MALFNIPYAQYAENHIYVRDIIKYVKCALNEAAHDVYISPNIRNDCTNIVVGVFDDVTADLIVKFAREGAKFIIIATEASTNPASQEVKIQSGSIFVGQGFADLGHRNLKKVAQVCKNIWCLSQSQLDIYAAILPREWLRVLPIGYVEGFTSADPFSNQLKDIDFMCLGTPAPASKRMMWELQSRGHNIFYSEEPPPDCFLGNLIGRSKMGLCLSQAEPWKNPSVIRNYHYLMNRCFFLTEGFKTSTVLDEYAETAEPETLIQTCEKFLKSGTELSEIAAQNLERFREEVPLKPLFSDFLEEILNNRMAA